MQLCSVQVVGVTKMVGLKEAAREDGWAKDRVIDIICARDVSCYVYVCNLVSIVEADTDRVIRFVHEMSPCLGSNFAMEMSEARR